jgi:peptidyl-prolyl cis-trans isomerase B (cyclophilin B)
VSQKHHRKQVAKARQKRQQDKYDRRAARNRIVIVVMAALMVLALIGGALVGLIGGGGEQAPAVDEAPVDEPAAQQDEVDPATDDAQAGDVDGPCPEPEDPPTITSEVYDEPPAMTIDTDATYVATFVTSCGDVEVELDAANAPIATNNLVNLAEDGYYDGVVFHRVIDGFVIQAGDPAGTGCGQEECTAEGFDPDAATFPGYTFEDELDRAQQVYAEVEEELAADTGDEGAPAGFGGGYPRGLMAMANAGPDTNGSQFYLTQGDPTLLPGPDFTVVGEVLSGMEVVDDIAASPTDELDRPLTDVVILEVVIEQG